MANRTRSGTGVGPGARRRYFMAEPQALCMGKPGCRTPRRPLEVLRAVTVFALFSVVTGAAHAQARPFAERMISVDTSAPTGHELPLAQEIAKYLNGLGI